MRKIQKVDIDTLAIIEVVKQYLFSIGIRVSNEKAFQIFKVMQQLPYMILIDRNKEGIKYQGSGSHLTHEEHGSQILAIQDIGRFELKAIKNRHHGYVPHIKYTTDGAFNRYLNESIKILDLEKENEDA